MEWTAEHNKLPTAWFFDTIAKVGVMCGIAVSVKEQGFAAGKPAKEVIR